jgi:hypothetical protein
MGFLSGERVGEAARFLFLLRQLLNIALRKRLRAIFAGTMDGVESIGDARVATGNGAAIFMPEDG